MDLFNYSRRQATEVNIGATPMGGTNPIRIQSMTNTVTMDTVACVEQAKRISIFTDEEYEQLDNIFKRRNFWCHNCYYDLAFDARTGGPKRRTDVDKMLSDLCDAKRLRENLYEKQMEWFEINAEQLREI